MSSFMNNRYDTLYHRYIQIARVCSDHYDNSTATIVCYVAAVPGYPYCVMLHIGSTDAR